MLLLIADRFFLLYTVMILTRIVGSWFPELQKYRFMHFIAFYVDPYLNFFRRWIPPLGMLDFSPIVAYLVLRHLIEPQTKQIIYLLFYR